MSSRQHQRELARVIGFLTAAGLGILVSATAANAITFNVAGRNNAQNTATVDFTYDSGLGQISISITNTAFDSVLNPDPRITAFAFNAPTNVSGVTGFTATGTEDDAAWVNYFSPNSISTNGTIGNFDIAGTTTNNPNDINAANGGSPNDGILAIAPNNTGIFTFTLSGTGLNVLTATSFLSILTDAKDGLPDAAFAARFQRTNADGQGSDVALGGPGPQGNIPPVPLPAAMPLFGTGLAIMGFIGWRRRRQTMAA